MVPLTPDDIDLAGALGWKRRKRLRGWDFEDMRAEALLAAVLAARSYSATGGATFRTYMWKKVNWHLSDSIRKSEGVRGVASRKMSRPVFQDLGVGVEMVDQCPSAIDLLGSADAVVKLRSSIGAKRVSVLWERFVQEMSLKDIGVARGVSESRACQLVGEALKAARAAFVDAETMAWAEAAGL